MNWKELFKSHSEYSPGEDLADSLALIVICALLCFIIFV
jgi:hypothetical protein